MGLFTLRKNFVKKSLIEIFEYIIENYELRGRIKKVLFLADVRPLEQRVRNAHEQNEQTLISCYRHQSTVLTRMVHYHFNKSF